MPNQRPAEDWRSRVPAVQTRPRGLLGIEPLRIRPAAAANDNAPPLRRWLVACLLALVLILAGAAALL